MRRLKNPLRAAEASKSNAVKEPILNKASTWVSIFANCTIVASLLLAYFSYLEQINQTKRSRTFEIASGLNSGEILDAQKAISRELLKLNLGSLQNVKLERDTLAALLQKLETTSGDPIEFRQNVITIVSYFDDAQICVETGTCDGAEMHQRVGPIAQRYACLFVPYILTVKTDYLLSGLGEGLQRMAAYEAHC
jgi:hypothetical protein